MSYGELEEGRIRSVFRRLEASMGPQHWWPGSSAFEVVVGAFLTQNTAWTNVEKALANLREGKILTVEGIREISLEQLEQLVRPAGYFRQKALRLKEFVAHLDARHGGRLQTMFAQPTEVLRNELLALKGIGPETADAILLYAAGHEVFVVDAYTRRIFERHALINAHTSYEAIRLAVQRALAEDEKASGDKELAPRLELPTHPPSAASQLPRNEPAQRYGEFHALILQTAKHFCLKREARCEACPLRALLP